MTFHQLRHTAATILLLKHVNPKVISEMLGHAIIAITLDTYSHVLPNMQHSAVAAMDVWRGSSRPVIALPDACTSESPPDNNLPLELSSFIGRKREMAEVKR